MAETGGAWARLDRAFDEALGPARGAHGSKVVLFSGGVDSGLLAWELRATGAASLFTVGVAGADDLLRAREAAPLIGLPWAGRTLDDLALAAVEREVEPELDGVDGPRRGIFVALAAACSEAPAGLLVCGQGADELFLGYAHFRGLTAEGAEARAATDLAVLQDLDWPRTLRIAGRWRRQLIAPYLHPEFVRAASEVPTRDRLPGALTKPFFRRWAAHRGLPEGIAERPKRALQYGSGVDRWLRRRHRRAV